MRKKLITIICILALISITLLTSCNKYVDGPKFSLLTKKARLQGNWKIDSYSVNGIDSTNGSYIRSLGDFEWDTTKDGHYTKKGNQPDAGTWKFGEDKDDVYFQSTVLNTGEDAHRILRLASSQLWLQHVESNGELHVLKLKQ